MAGPPQSVGVGDGPPFSQPLRQHGIFCDRIPVDVDLQRLVDRRGDHTRTATSPTPPAATASNANASAASLTGEPSIPTTTGRPPRRSLIAGAGRLAAVGIGTALRGRDDVSDMNWL